MGKPSIVANRDMLSELVEDRVLDFVENEPKEVS